MWIDIYHGNSIFSRLSYGHGSILYLEKFYFPVFAKRCTFTSPNILRQFSPESPKWNQYNLQDPCIWPVISWLSTMRQTPENHYLLSWSFKLRYHQFCQERKELKFIFDVNFISLPPQKRHIKANPALG